MEPPKNWVESLGLKRTRPGAFSEADFWRGLIKKYLQPIEKDEKKEKETQTKLIELRWIGYGIFYHSVSIRPSGWRSGNALAFHRCDPGSIPGVGMWDGHVVTKSDRWVSSGHSGFLPHEYHPNANISANEHARLI